MSPLIRRALAGAFVVLPTVAFGQALPDVAGRPAVIKVQLVDSANVAVQGAEISVVEGLKNVLGSGTTNARGRVDVSVGRGSTQLEVVARKIGLARASIYVRANRDTIPVLLTMHRPVQQLGAVEVTAREDVKRKSYHVDADEIAAFNRPLVDGMDVLTKMKPDILYGRMPGCGVENVWINGKLIRGVLPDEMVQARRGLASPPRPVPRSKGSMAARPPVIPKIQTVNADPLTIMAGLKAEHILEMNFLDCFATSELLHGNAALYVILKDGIGFDGRQTYVMDVSKLPFKSPEMMLAPEPALPVEQATPAPEAPTLPSASNAAYRRRLVGVFDDATGMPLQDVELVDLATGTIARTTITGTATLAFLPEGPSTLEIRRGGYLPLRLDVTISPKDTMALTLLLTPKKP
jgi:hypothetical protein